MKDVVVAMWVSQVCGFMTENVERLSSAGITVHIEPLEGQSFAIANKMHAIRRMAERFRDYRYMILSDGWDVLFFGTKWELMEHIPEDRVVWAAEKNCWPEEELKAKVPDRGPWKFANGGLLAGTPKAYLDMCRMIEAHPDYNPDYVDQGFMNRLLAEGADFFAIDTETKLFFCLFLGYEELEFRHGRPYNSLHKTWPLFIHANGRWPVDEMIQKYEASLA